MKRPAIILITVVMLLLACFIPAISTGAEGLSATPTPTPSGPQISLSPGSGFSSITIQGAQFPADFAAEIPVVITWDGTKMATFPSVVYTNSNYYNGLPIGYFSAIVNVPAGAGAGNHRVRATQDNGDGGLYYAEAAFQVIDMSGAKGDSGAAGAAGAKGERGDPGLMGWAGANGSSGAAGPVGPAGPQGPAGAQGPAGVRGSEGQPGPAGTPGPAGSPGTAGPPGPAGPEGKSGGSGLTALSIAALAVSAGTLALFILAIIKRWIFG